MDVQKCTKPSLEVYGWVTPHFFLLLRRTGGQSSSDFNRMPDRSAVGQSPTNCQSYLGYKHLVAATRDMP